MEDAHISDINKGINQRYHIFGVFDGHGGKEVSQFAKKYFTNELLSYITLYNGNIQKSLKSTFLKIDELLISDKGKKDLIKFRELSIKEDMQQNNKNTDSTLKPNSQFTDINDIIYNTGCTACVCIIDTKDKKMYFANAGDSRAVLCRNGKAQAMSIDHKPELELEKQRIYKAKGWIIGGRVNGNLNLSRGLGDLEYKQNKDLSPDAQIITANPDIRVESIDDSCDFIIIGCDGIWDCLTNDEAVNIIKDNLSNKSSQKISFYLENLLDNICAVDKLNVKGIGCDNMTIIVIVFKK